MALSDFWQVKDNQVYNGKPLLNVYHVKRILVGATAGPVGQAFIDSVLDGGLDAMQPNGVSRTTLEIENLGDPTDFASIGVTGYPGQLTAQPLPSFNTATIQFNRTRTDMKNGMKRFFVGTEEEQDAGDWVPGMITSLNTLALSIITPWEDDSSPGIEVCEFVILKRWCVVPEQSPCLKYRLPDDDDEIDDFHYVPVSYVSQPRVRSQVSRKVLS
jgi:hypothetical protein